MFNTSTLFCVTVEDKKMARKKSGVYEGEEVSAIAVADFVPEAQPVVVVEEEDNFQMSSDDHREQIMKCVTNLQFNFIAICQLLYQAQKLRRFESWGYGSFKEYAQKELGFKYGKAKALVNLWQHIGSKDREMFDSLMSVGWDKANEISRVVNKENLAEWVDKAKVLSADDLKREVKNYILALVPKDSEEALALEQQATDAGITGITDELHYRNFAFDYEQLQTINQAIVLIKRQNPEIQSEAACLAWIAAEFLASNSEDIVDSDGEQATVSVVSKMCAQRGIDAVLVRRHDSTILQGQDTLHTIVAGILGNQ
jgi:hypothetical protein